MNTQLINRKILFWLAIGAVLILFLHAISSILLPFVVGIMVAYFLDPAADYLESKGCSRLVATGTLTVGFFAVAVLVLFLLAPLLTEQLMALVHALPTYVDHLMDHFREGVAPYVERLRAALRVAPKARAQEVLGGVTGQAWQMVQGFIIGVFASGKAVVNVITLVFLTPVVTFYLLRDWDVMVAKVDTMIPPENRASVRTQLKAIDDVIASYLRGQVYVCLILAVYYSVMLSFFGLKYSVLLGVVTGIISFIPFVGALVSFTIAVTIAFFQFDDLPYTSLVVGIYLVGQILEGYVLVPNLVGNKVGLHPAWVIFGMLSGGVLLGFVGVLLAVPITAVIGVLLRSAMERYRDSAIYQGEGKSGRPKRQATTRKRA